MNQSEYTIVQFVPDPITGERINVGIIAYDNQAVECRFIDNWSRVRCFAGADIGFLKDFSHKISRQLDSTSRLDMELGHSPAITPELILKMSQEWGGSIQLTAPKSSPRPREAVLSWAVKRLLTDTATQKKAKVVTDAEMRDRMLRIVTAQTKLFLLPESTDSLLHKDYQWRGELENHVFKAALANGHNLAGFDGISMDNPSRGIVQASRIKWAISDIRRVNKESPLLIAIRPPKKELDDYRDLQKVIRDLKGEPVPDDEVEYRIAEMLEQVVPISYRRLPSKDNVQIL